MAGHACDLMSPGANLHRSPLDFDGDALLHGLSKIIDRPSHRLLRLPPLLVESLIEIAPPVQERDPDHRHATRPSHDRPLIFLAQADIPNVLETDEPVAVLAEDQLVVFLGRCHAPRRPDRHFGRCRHH